MFASCYVEANKVVECFRTCFCQILLTKDVFNMVIWDPVGNVNVPNGK